MTQEMGKEAGELNESVWFLVLVDNRILLQRRLVPDKSSFGEYVIPGGHVEPKEKIEDAMIREIEEEAGVVPVDNIYLGGFNKTSTRGNTFYVHLYLVLGVEGEIKNRELDKHKFMFATPEAAYELVSDAADKLAILLTTNYVKELN